MTVVLVRDVVKEMNFLVKNAMLARWVGISKENPPFFAVVGIRAETRKICFRVFVRITYKNAKILFLRN